MTSLTAMTKKDYRALALASVLQCSKLIDKIARTGTLDPREINTLQEPVFVLNPRDGSDIYPQPSTLLPGLVLLETLSKSGSLRPLQQTVHYSVGILRFADAVIAQPQLAAQIRHGIESIHRDATVELSEQQVQQQTALLAEVYKNTLSQQPRPIQVQGSASVLRDADNAAAIRALLLAGVRSALFWRQLDGSRWQLLLQRKQLAQAASRLKKQTLQGLH